MRTEKITPFIFVKSLMLAAFAGILLYLSFPELNWWFLSFFAFAVLFSIVRTRYLVFNFVIGLVFGAAFFSPLFFFVTKTADFTGFVILVAVESLFTATMTTAYALFVKIAPVFRKSRFISALLFSVLWVLFEELRSLFPFGGFAWGKLSYMEVPTFISAYSWLGSTQLCSFLIVFIGTALGMLFSTFHLYGIYDETKQNGSSFMQTIVIAAVCCAIFFGSNLIPINKQSNTSTLSFVAIQGSVQDASKGEKNDLTQSFDTQTEATENFIEEYNKSADKKSLDLVIWPEICQALNNPEKDKTKLSTLSSLSEQLNAPILTGSQRTQTDEKTGEKYVYKDTILYDGSEGIIGTHTKKHLVPFGEYLPNRDLLKKILGDNYSNIEKKIPIDARSGSDNGVIELSGGKKIGVLTCFEASDDSIIKEEIDAGAQAFIVPSGTALFGYSNESLQQLEICRARAIQTGKYFIQVGDAGVSAIVSPDGTITDKTTLFKQTYFTGEINLNDAKSPAMQFSNYIYIECIGALGILLLAGLFISAKPARQRMRRNRK